MKHILKIAINRVFF